MDQDQPIPPARPDAATEADAADGKPAAVKPVDWIDARLRSIYDEVVSEPLPAELQALLDGLLKAPDTGGGAG